VTGTPRPVVEDRATIGALQMIAAHVGKPCPTRRDIMEWTGVARRNVWAFLAKLQERGLIEIEVEGPDLLNPAGKAPRLRRMRAVTGRWTEWTARFHDRTASGSPGNRRDRQPGCQSSLTPTMSALPSSM
jgi:hypothetical protein